MNYCTKCESFYQKPGTCNCFAGTQPAITITPQPYDPNSTAQPWTVTPYPWTTIKWTTDLMPQSVTASELVKWAGTMMGGDTSHMITE